MSPSLEFEDPMQRPRYTGLPTFMRAPYSESLSEMDIAMIGVPFDGGVTNRPGTRHGTREVRNQSSLMRRINQATGVGPYDLCRVADVGDAWVEKPFELIGALDEIGAYYKKVVAANVVPMSCGGDHGITLPILRAVGAKAPVGMVHFDAHCDTGSHYLGSNYHHGAPFARAVEEGVLDPKRVVQIGIRGGVNDVDVWKISYESGMRVIPMDEAHRMGMDALIAEARRVVGDGPTYLSFDIDGLDPVYAPGTGTPEIGGFTSLEALLLLRGLRGIDFIGGDVVEVSPPFDPSGLTALTGASMMFEILCLLAEAFDQRASGS
ncbi:MAG: agmatinase [Geminicoccaceae bacterium]